MVTATSLQTTYPWTTTPFVANGPMAGFAGSSLATAVTQAKGLGFIGTINDMAKLSTQLEETSNALLGTKVPSDGAILPIGVGFLTFIAKLDEAVPVIAKFRPAAVWFFAAQELEHYATWTKRVREASPLSKIWIQINSVAGALHVAQLCAPDVLVMQGSDAGGHGWEKGASVISLLPEATDVLQAHGFGHIPLVAAGGISDGRGTAAALALGASGVVMGTRFLSAPETILPHKGYQDALLDAKDGGQSTVRAKVFDELKGPNIWPVLFDGRGLVTESYNDHVNGVSIDEIRRLHAEAVKGEGAGFEADKRRAVVWAGTGVGLVNKVQSAKDIIDEVREAARASIDQARASL